MAIPHIPADLDDTREDREALYKHFRKNPELALQEFSTAGKIESELKSYGVDEILRIGETGVAAVVKNGDGTVAAMRGDIDGFPMA